MGIVSLLVLLYAVAFNYRRNHDPAQVRFVENAAEAAAEPAADAGRTLKPVFSGRLTTPLKGFASAGHC